ncbi:MAG: ROK family protein [Actinomycetaceae bacterium]|nr:ROK family protein [Actinomycetaceae bacterium]
MTKKTKDSHSSLRRLRHDNIELVLQCLRSSGPLSQADLARQTGLSRATISNVVHVLEDEKRVESTSGISRGRRARIITIRETVHYYLGIHFAHSYISFVLISRDYSIVHSHRVVLVNHRSHFRRVHAVIDAAHNFARDAGITFDDVCAVGLAIPSPVDKQTHSVYESPILPQWVTTPLIADIIDAFDVQCFYCNDASAAVLASAQWGAAQGCQHVLYCILSHGIGGGLLLGGEVYEGAYGLAGEIGHIQLPGETASCRCGNRGCLEAVASTDAIVRRAHESGLDISTYTDLLGLLKDKNVTAQRLLSYQGVQLGRAFSDVADVISPSKIVIGGEGVELMPFFIEDLIVAFQRTVMPVLVGKVAIVPETLDQDVVCLGAAVYALRESLKS